MMQGALQHMGEPELQHWMHLTCCRTLATSAQAVQQLLQGHGQRPTGQKASVQVKNGRVHITGGNLCG